MEQPKYTRLEYERRFLVDAGCSWREGVKPYTKLFQDRYLDCGRLRLRRLADSDSDRVVFKLTKKFESESSFARPVVNIWLSPAEYEALATLPANTLSKTRHYDDYQGLVFSIDVFDGELAGLILCETETEGLDTLHAARFPPYARWEVTEDPFFTGGSLCRAERWQVEAAIARVKAA